MLKKAEKASASIPLSKKTKMSGPSTQDKERHIAATKAVLAAKRADRDKLHCNDKSITKKSVKNKWCQAAFARNREAKRYKIQSVAHSPHLVAHMEILTRTID